MTTKNFAALGAALLLSTSSFGYIRRATSLAGDTSPAPLVRHDNTAIQFLVNNGVTAGAQSSASGKNVTVISPQSDPVAAIRAALASYNAVTNANVNFLPLKSTSLGIDASDNNMVVAIGSTPADVSLVGSALAVTATAYALSSGLNGTTQVNKGDIIDTDIILNPGIAFSTDGSTANDLQAIMLHEFGHSLGANHTGLLGASMFQFNSNQRFLTADDTAFVNAVYPSSQPAPSGTLSGIVTLSGTPVPYALVTAFDTSSGITIGGITGTDGSYSISVPPGNYRVYAEPLITGVVQINLYLTADQFAAATASKFQSTLAPGSVAVSAGGTGSMNIAVTPGTTTIAAPFTSVSSVNGIPGSFYLGGAITAPSGGSVDIIFAGAEFDESLTDANFSVYGNGITLRAGSVRVDKNITVGFQPILRATLDIAATNTPSLASYLVTKGGNTLSFSGGVLIVPPTPSFISAGVISAAPYTGIQGGVTPGGIYSIYSTDAKGNPTQTLGPAAFVQNGPYDAYNSLPTTLAGVSVTFDGIPAPMFLAYSGQLNFQVPFEIAGKTSTKVVVNYLGSASAAVLVPVLKSQPSFFVTPGTTAVRAINKIDGTINSAQNPAPRSTASVPSFVEIYGTGVGSVSYGIATGQPAPVFPAGFSGNYTYTIGGSAAAPAYFGGYTPTAAGLAQWDLQVPANSPTGAVSVAVTDSNGVSSPAGMTIYLK
jgi:uncharacterized protein (TIGR03437 family)